MSFSPKKEFSYVGVLLILAPTRIEKYMLPPLRGSSTISVCALAPLSVSCIGKAITITNKNQVLNVRLQL